MARDYVKRDKPKKRTEEHASGIGVKGVLLVIALVGCVVGFVTFLYSIKDNAPTAPQSKPTQPLPSLMQPQSMPSSDDGLPPKPKERSYIKELENKEVKIDLPELDNKPTRPYLMQCGSFRTQPQAEELKAKIAFQGLEAIIKSSDGKNGRWYRVILGPFETKRKAESARHRLGRAKIRGCQIWFW